MKEQLYKYLNGFSLHIYNRIVRNSGNCYKDTVSYYLGLGCLNSEEANRAVLSTGSTYKFFYLI